MAFNEKYNLIWKNEIIDSFDNLKDAKEMKIEYDMAYKSSVEIQYSFDEEAALKEEAEYIENWAMNVNKKLI